MEKNLYNQYIALHRGQDQGSIESTTQEIKMDRAPVSSSKLTSIGYNPQERILEIEFLNGSVYQYFDVPSNIYSGLMSASSHGRYFDAYIKKGGYSYRQIK